MIKKEQVKALLLIFLLTVMLFLLTGCGDLNPSEVDKAYVQKKMEQSLKTHYGTEFVVEIISFAENSDDKSSVAEAYPKVDPSLKCEIKGAIEGDYFDASRIGSSYHLKYNFSTILFRKIEEELSPKYSFELIGNVNYKEVANNVRQYIKDFQNLLDNYKTGSDINVYFHDKYEYATIPLTKNGEAIDEKIYIDKRNNKVIIDLSSGEYGWIGELELDYYLELLATDKLDDVVSEIHKRHYHSNNTWMNQ